MDLQTVWRGQVKGVLAGKMISTLRLRLAIPFALIMMLGPLAAVSNESTTCTIGRRPHACMNATDPIASCEAEVRSDPSDASARLALCEANLRKGNLAEATAVLRRGLEICSGSAVACTN